MEINKYKLFNEVLNQSKDSKYRYACTVFSCAVNLSYNCGIKFTMEDINTIIDQMVLDWKLNLKAWAYGADATRYVLTYIKENARLKWWTMPKLITLVNDVDVINYTNAWYSVITWIWVNKKFIEDVPDWKIDTKDYALLKWNDLKHYLNIIKSDKGYLIDNYAWNSQWREWLYECKIQEVLKHIDQNIKFLFKY